MAILMSMRHGCSTPCVRSAISMMTRLRVLSITWRSSGRKRALVRVRARVRVRVRVGVRVGVRVRGWGEGEGWSAYSAVPKKASQPAASPRNSKVSSSRSTSERRSGLGLALALALALTLP